MALRAIQFRMLPNQRKTRIAMVEGRIAPPAGRMAGTAVRAKLTVMVVI